MALSWNPVLDWKVLLLAAGVLVVLLLLAAGRRRRRAAAGRQILALLCELVALAALVLAAANPRIVDQPPESPAHLAVVLDVSESALRNPTAWEEARAATVALLRQNGEMLPATLLADGRASIIAFSTAVRGDDLPLRELADELTRTPPGPLANGAASNLGDALLEASRRIVSSGRGAVVLVSDGNDTAGGVSNAALQLSRQGVPVWVVPVHGGDPTLALELDLPRLVEAGATTALRGAIYHRGATPVQVSLAYTRNAGIPASLDLPLGASAPSPQFDAATLAQDEYISLHPELAFQGLGLQYVDVTLQEDGQLAQQRRLFTTVDRPIRLLAIGGDNTWTQAMPPDGVEIVQQLPEDLTPPLDLAQFDGVVVSGVPAERFVDGALDDLAQAVEEGLGLMLLNGAHTSASDETPTVLRSYADTPLDRVLPLTADPRQIAEEAPPRYVAVLLDTSGSMDGWKIDKAKQIVAHIVQTLLTRRDTLDLIAFTCGADRVVHNLTMTDANKPTALQGLDSFGPDGGTCPEEALNLVQTGDDCNLLFVSDGEFAPLAGRPDCKCIAFAVEGQVGPGSTLNDLCQEVHEVHQDFNPAEVGFPTLEGKLRDKFWEVGDFLPRVVQAPNVPAGLPSIPALELHGSAIGYKKPDTLVAAYRPKFADPVLAYKEAGAGYAGVLVTGFPTEWLAAAEGSAAVQDWILRTVSYAARRRYEFKIEDLGRSLRLQIALLPQDGSLPEVTDLEVQIQTGAASTPVSMAPVAGAPGVFTGFVDAPRRAEAQSAWLVVEETGRDALLRPQRVPLLLPPEGLAAAANGQEAATWGLDEQLLRDLAAQTGGGYEPDPGTLLLRSVSAVSAGVDLWPLLLALAALSYLAAIMLRRLD